jgi:hypothetical protein
MSGTISAVLVVAALYETKRQPRSFIENLMWLRLSAASFNYVLMQS